MNQQNKLGNICNHVIAASGSNYQDIFKVIALVTMLIDHTGAFILWNITTLRIVGRISGFLFFFFAGHNYKINSKIKKQYILFACVIMFGSYLTPHFGIRSNALFSISAGCIFLHLLLSAKNQYIQSAIAIIALLLMPFTRNILEYSTMVFLIMLGGYCYKQKIYPNIALLASLCLWLIYNIAYNSKVMMYNLPLLLILHIVIFVTIRYTDLKMPIRYNLRSITQYCAHIYLVQYIVFFLIYTFGINQLIVLNS